MLYCRRGSGIFVIGDCAISSWEIAHESADPRGRRHARTVLGLYFWLSLSRAASMSLRRSFCKGIFPTSGSSGRSPTLAASRYAAGSFTRGWEVAKKRAHSSETVSLSSI